MPVRPVRRAFLCLFATFLSFASPHAPGQVNIEILLSDDATVSGIGAAEAKNFQLPKPNRSGSFFAKGSFFDDSGDTPTAGTIIVEATGGNAAQVLLRDDLAGLEPLTYAPFYPADNGDVFFQGNYMSEESTTGSVFKVSGGAVTRLKASAGIDAATFNGTALIRNIENSAWKNVATLSPDGSESIFPLFGGEVPQVDGTTFKAFNTIAYNPSGRIFFNAQFEGDSIDFSNDRAIFTDDGAGNLVQIVREADTYPNTPRLPEGGIFRDLTTNTTLSCNDLGMLAFRASVNAPDARPSGSANSLWRYVPGQDFELIAVDNAPLATANAGELRLGPLNAGAGDHNMVPILDAAGNVYFGALVSFEEPPYSRIAIFKYDGSATHLVGYLNTMLTLPEDIPDPQVRLEALAVSASGRIAMYVTIYNGRDGLAASLFAQDDKGVFTEVLTRNVSEYTFARQNLVVGGNDLGRAGTIYPPQKNAQFIGSEDGPKHPWWTADDRLLFGVSWIENDQSETAYVLATIGEPKIPASGDRYTWDGGVETARWQTVDAGKTNWVDSIGARWNLPPNRANAEVTIPAGKSVTLEAGNVQVGSLDSQGTLDLFSTLSIRGDAQVATVNIEEGGALIVEGNATLKGDITANKTPALIIDAPSGDVSIDSTANTPHLASSTASTILASAPGNIFANVKGELSTTAGPPTGSTANIEANSEGGSVSLTTNGTFDAIGSTGSMLNLYASAAGDISANLQGSYSSSGPNVLLESTGGSISVDTSKALLTGEAGAINADTKDGSVSIKSGEIAASGFDAIHATANGEISISAYGPIDLIDGSFAIYAESSGSSVEIDSRATISTTGQVKPGIGIEGKAQTDVTIKQRAPINSDFVALVAFSTAGTVDIDTSATYLAGEQGGIRATAEGGSILIESGEIAASNQQGIYAVAQQSVSIESNGAITAIGDQSSGIFASSEQAGVSIIQNGDVSATGTLASGIVAVSPTTIDLRINSGSVSGWTEPNQGVYLGDAQNATLTNYGDISSASEVGVKTTSVNTTIENYGRIHGDIQLGSGNNILNNHPGAYLYAAGTLAVGENNTLHNQGSLILSELVENIGTTNLTGKLQQSASSSLTLLVETETASDLLSVSGTASLDGSLIVQIIDDLAEAEQYTILQASSLSGQFSGILPVQTETVHIEDLAAHARQHPSRSIGASVVYSENDVTLSIQPLVLDSYQSWADHFLGETDPAPSAQKDLEADPDKDGLSNLAEYVLGTHPSFASASPFSSQIVRTEAGPNLALEFTIANQLSGVTWTLQQSDSLESWEPVSIEGLAPTNIGDVSRYQIMLPSDAISGFFRLSVNTTDGAATTSVVF